MTTETQGIVDLTGPEGTLLFLVWMVKLLQERIHPLAYERPDIAHAAENGVNLCGNNRGAAINTLGLDIYLIVPLTERFNRQMKRSGVFGGFREYEPQTARKYWPLEMGGNLPVQTACVVEQKNSGILVMGQRKRGTDRHRMDHKPVYLPGFGEFGHDDPHFLLKVA